MPAAPAAALARRSVWVAAGAVAALIVVSLFVGVLDIGLDAVLSDPETRRTFFLSRVARTAALVLSGSALAVAGLIMQQLTQNRFVAPSTAGTVDAAAGGLLVAALFFAGSAVMWKVLFALGFALAGTLLFVALIRRIQFRDPLLVPLTGIVLGGVYRAVAEFFAYRHNLTQSLSSWFVADFSGIIAGRYETLWFAGAVAVAAYVFANRFTAAGMGEAFATSIGVNYRLTMLVGLGIASLATAVVVVTVGSIPFLGLVVPNVVSLSLGDNVRRVLPVTAMLGASVVLFCDIVGRLVIAPYEVAVGVIVGVIGSGVFLVLVLRRGHRYAAG
ncbi:MAG: ABC transporter permease [Acidimicrobiales bacterium]